VFFVLGTYTEYHTIAKINSINHQYLGYPEYLHLVFFLVGFLAICSIYFAEKMEVIVLSQANATLEKEINKRNQTEDALRKSEEMNKELYAEAKRAEEVYRSLLHSSADAIVIYDLEGKAGYISPVFTQIFGWTLEEVKGKRISFVPVFEKESTMAIIKDLVEKGTPCRGFETKRYTKDGRLLDVSISASRYNDHRGSPTGLLVILRDISEKKKLEAQLQYTERIEAIGTLAGGIAHDFNNLMMGMLGNISLILYDTEPVNPHYEKLINIEKLIQSGSKLTKQLLGYARKGKYEVKAVNLNQIVKESCETFGRTRKNIKIYKELAKDLLAIKADESQIEQVFMNLYINAADAMPDGGDLLLQTMNATHMEMSDKRYDPKPGEYVLLKVTDKGTGIDEKIIDRIFEPFFTTKEIGRGSGLGLASTYGIIKGHGGYIDVDSEKGHGTTFSIYLPASGKSIHKTMENSEQIIKGNETVLLVDDEEIAIDVGVQILEKLGYTVFEARSGKEAVRVFNEKRDKIDMVILDMIMPDMGGREAYEKMKEIDSEVKVLLSSGYSIDGQANEILKRGCNGFIQKPFNMKDLSKEIREVLKKD
jgi:PAS domain S-box-containing protein